MCQSLAVTLVILIPIAYGQTYNNTQIYFPDDEKFVVKRPHVNGFSVVPPPFSPSLDQFVAPSPSQSVSPTVSQFGALSPSQSVADQIISRGLAKLTIEINKAYQEKVVDENIVFAPLNIAAALALVLLGSNGKTFQELTSVLGFATGLEIENRSEQVHRELGRMINKIEATAGIVIGQQVTFADAVFVQNNYPIRKLYKEAAENLYHSEVVNVDFQSNPEKAKQSVNAWVSDRTNGKIKDILNDVPSDTKVIIASAMYFKAEWEKPFLANDVTARREFFANGRRSKPTMEVDMMANIGEFPYYKDNNLQAEILGLPYKGNSTVMYVVMPFNSNKEVLKEFEDRITESDLEYLVSQTVSKNCQILFPKMKIESTIRLKPVLIKLGVTSLFAPNEANLGLLSPGIGSITTSSAINPLAPFHGNPNDVLIFSRTGELVNCSAIFDPKSNISTCQDTVANQRVMYKKFGDKVGRRIARNPRRITRNTDTIDSLRNLINQQSTDTNYQNPGLYAEDVIHKVFMDITETGTEAAASTLVTLYRSFRGVTFRVDVPFLFFIRHEETKTILFWGSVYKPTPNYRTG